MTIGYLLDAELDYLQDLEKEVLSKYANCPKMLIPYYESLWTFVQEGIDLVKVEKQISGV